MPGIETLLPSATVSINVGGCMAFAAHAVAEMPSRLTALAHLATPAARHAILLVFHAALAPANFVLSLATASFHAALPALGGVHQIVGLFLKLWM